MKSTSKMFKALLGGGSLLLAFALGGQAVAQTLLPNGDFETGDLTSWTPSGINGGFAVVVAEGTCWSFFDTRGITLNGNHAANVRSSGPAPTSSVGILTSNPFVASGGVSFQALSERSSALQANPVNFEVRILAVLSGSIISSQVVGTNLITMTAGPCGDVPVGPNGTFSQHTIDTSTVAGQIIQVEFRQNTNFAGSGFFTLVDDVTLVPLPVSIDIKPGSDPNSINLRSRGVIPVAVLTTATFDATTVDPTTVRFGKTGTEATPVQFALKDVDLDGDIDRILHFKTQNTGILCGDTSASLTGQTFDGQMIKGSDSVNTVGCKY